MYSLEVNADVYLAYTFYLVIVSIFCKSARTLSIPHYIRKSVKNKNKTQTIFFIWRDSPQDVQTLKHDL